VGDSTVAVAVGIGIAAVGTVVVDNSSDKKGLVGEEGTIGEDNTVDRIAVE